MKICLKQMAAAWIYGRDAQGEPVEYLINDHLFLLRTQLAQLG
jgi:hypothetical protein